MLDDLQEEKFSEDPDEQLRIENEILKLKIQAELGGDFEGEASLPPEVENTFLKNVLEFEHKQANAPVKTLFEILGEPYLRKHFELTDAEIVEHLNELENLMEEKGIIVDYATDYPARTKFQFITEELFQKEAPDIDIPGMTMHYIYEEFHPNHSLDIESITTSFFNNWMNKSFNESSVELAHDMILEDGSILSSDQVIESMRMLFDSYETFSNTSYSIDTISYELHEKGTGLGFSEGVVAYDALLESGEVQHYQGPFKLYMQYDGFWSVFFFTWPGFIW
jgi:hypothetical protein